jgi:hypothetical protein
MIWVNDFRLTRGIGRLDKCQSPVIGLLTDDFLSRCSREMRDH